MVAGREDSSTGFSRRHAANGEVWEEVDLDVQRANSGLAQASTSTPGPMMVSSPLAVKGCKTVCLLKRSLYG